MFNFRLSRCVFVCVLLIPALAANAFTITATEIARVGEQMPGQAAGVNFADFEYNSTRLQPVMASNGVVAFLAGVSSEARSGMFSGNGGAPIELTRLSPSGTPLRSITSLSAGGGAVGVVGVNSASQKGFFVMPAGVAGAPVNTIARVGTVINGVAAQSDYFGDGGIDDAGNIAFGGGGGVYRQSLGGTIQTIRADPNNGRTFPEGINIGDGRVAYSELTIIPGGVNTVDINNIYQHSGNTRLLSVAGTDLIPGTNKTWAADQDSYPDPFRSATPVIDGNQMFFRGRRFTSVSQNEFDGIYRATLRSAGSAATRDSVVPVVRRGDPVPDIPGAQFGGPFIPQSADAGMMVFFASHGINQTGIYGAVGSFIYPILRVGDVVPSDTGNETVRAITRLGRDSIQGNSIAVVLRIGASNTPAVYRLDLGPGSNQAAALMPSSSGGGIFDFDLDLGSDGPGIDFPIWLDPPSAFGYRYDAGGQRFASVTLPVGFNIDESGIEQPFTVEFDGFSVEAFGGETVSFTDSVTEGIAAFEILDILEDVHGVSDTIAAGLTFVAPATGGPIGQFTVTQTSIPEPAGLTLLALAGAALTRRRRR